MKQKLIVLALLALAAANTLGIIYVDKNQVFTPFFEQFF